MTDETPEGVLSPDDLELADERVAELGDGRYVIDAGDSPSSAKPDAREVTDDRGGDRLADLRELPEAYAVSAAVKTDAGVAETSVRSDDLGETFESFVRWYAARVDPDRSPEEVLAVLASASDLDVSVRVDR